MKRTVLGFLAQVVATHGPCPGVVSSIDFVCPFCSMVPASNTPRFFGCIFLHGRSQARKLETAAKKDEKRAKDR